MQRQGSSNFVAASSLLRLHRAVAMAAAIVTSVPRDLHPPPGRRRGLLGRASRRGRLAACAEAAGLAACEEGPRRKETTNLLVLERERVWVGISAPSPPSHESSSLDVTLYIFM